MAHPPRSNPPLRSSSAAPSPCITPSTVTCVMVVSSIGSSFLSRWSFSLCRTEALQRRLRLPALGRTTGQTGERRLTLDVLLVGLDEIALHAPASHQAIK